nr:substrate-binding domain-containing protein [Bacillus pakistanensis]
MKIGWVADPKLAEFYPYFSSVYAGISEGLVQADYTLVNIYKEELQNEASLHKAIHESDIEGLILIDNIDDSILQYIMKFLPVVGVDFNYTDKDMTVIDFDREGAVRTAVNHLIQLGHKEIGFIGGGIGGSLHDEKRYTGYRHAMEEAKLEIRLQWVFNTEWALKESYNSMNRLLKESRHSLPTAMVCASDMLSIAAMRAVVENGMRIPEDIAFIGVDNIEMSQYSSPPLTTIDIPKYEIGEMAAKVMIDQVEEKITLPIKTIVPYKLIVREST